MSLGSQICWEFWRLRVLRLGRMARSHMLPWWATRDPRLFCCTPKSGVFLQLTKARCAYLTMFSWYQQPPLQPDHASSHCCRPTHCGFLLGWARLARPGRAQGHSSGLACISPGLVAQTLYQLSSRNLGRCRRAVVRLCSTFRGLVSDSPRWTYCA